MICNAEYYTNRNRTQGRKMIGLLPTNSILKMEEDDTCYIPFNIYCVHFNIHDLAYILIRFLMQIKLINIFWCAVLHGGKIWTVKKTERVKLEASLCKPS